MHWYCLKRQTFISEDGLGESRRGQEGGWERGRIKFLCLTQARKQVLTGVGLAPTAPTVGHAHKHFIGIEDDLTGRLLLELSHQTHPAGVAFAGGIVEACGRGREGK